MFCANGKRLIDYLWERKIEPEYEIGGSAFYRYSAGLR